ncbi:unnamed protein product [Durusdinium trenchii]|uniref:Zinc ribbon domain-containing protein n=1 Tax=Durusdinium trenchii TaxID=1381693 RepID=A0ABP0SRF7_9DINO
MPKIFERDESLPENAWIASSSSVIDRGGAILTRPWKDVMGWDVGRVSTPVPFTAAQPPEFPELDDSAPSRCGRCGSTLAAENNFCGRCGLARSTDRGYQHPEKLLPGPPLRHDASQPGPMIKPALGPSSGRPGPPGSLGPPPGTVRPGGVCPGPGGPLLGPPKGTIKSSCRPMNRKHCAPAMGPVCG